MKRALLLAGVLAACRSAPVDDRSGVDFAGSDFAVVSGTPGTVVLTLRSADAIEAGDVLDIRRGNELVGRVYVTEVSGTTASGTFEETWLGAGGPARRGDSVEKVDVPRPPAHK